MAASPSNHLAPPPTPFTITPATAEDIDTIAQISGDSFDHDTHTLLKAHWRGANHHRDGSKADLATLVDNPKCDFLVGRTGNTTAGPGKVIGFVVWHKRGYTEDEDGDEDGSAVPLFARGDGDVASTLPECPPPVPAQPERGTQLGLTELEATTNAAMTHYIAHLMPAGTSCRFISRMSVDPGYQGQGVGSALVRWGTDRADTDGVYCWVSSSMDGYHVYEKAGFVEVGRQELVLDDYAQGVKREMGEDWGLYVWKWMRRDPAAR